jgi:uncharacterized protein YkwD
MRTLGAIVAVLGLVAAACCSFVLVSAGGPRIGVGASVARPVSSRAEVELLADQINRHRVAIGCRALIPDRRLAAVARRHSEDMVRRRFFDHTNPDGRDPFERLRTAGIRYRAAAENIAQGRTRGRDTYDDWIESPGHRHNIENCKYTHFGIGLYRNTWTLDLVRYEDD